MQYFLAKAYAEPICDPYCVPFLGSTFCGHTESSSETMKSLWEEKKKD